MAIAETKWEYIDDLVTGTPNGATDPVSEGDDQLAGLKDVLTTQLPNLGQAAVTKTAAELNAAITADSTDTLTNKTIEDGTYTGTQTGFVGDVDGDITGNADTATLATEATNITNQGALATLDSVGAAQVDDNSVRFSNEIATVTDNGSWSFNGLSTVQQVLPRGVFNLFTTPSTGTHVATLEIVCNSQWRTVQTLDANQNPSINITSDGASVRINSPSGGSGSIIVDYKKIY